MAKLARFEFYPDTKGFWRFRLVASNGEVVGSGEGYGSQRDARRGARALRLAALTARTVEGTN